MPDGKEKECGQHGWQIGMAERRAHAAMTTILRHTLLWIWRHARPFSGGLLLDIVIGIVGNWVYDSLKTEPTLYQDPSKLALVQSLLVSRWISLGIFLLLLVLLLAAFLVHRADERRLALEHQHQQQALAEHNQQQQEALSLTTQAVRVLLERQTSIITPPPAESEGVLHTSPRIWTVPFQRNPFFTGREDELRAVHTQLHRGQATAITHASVSSPTALSGLGGIGKTQLAVEYAYRHRLDYQAILWVRADTLGDLTTSYVALAHTLHLPEASDPEQDRIIQAVKAWLASHEHWLLIYDNADTLSLLPPFLPTPLTGHVLLTTRASALGTLAHPIEITTFSEEQGALLVLHRARCLAPEELLEQASQTEQQCARAITRTLDGLALALDQAGAYLEETHTALVDYLPLYQQHRRHLLETRRSILQDHPHSVSTTFSLAFERVEQRHPAAADLLRLCAFLAPDAIPEELLTAKPSVLGPVLAPIMADLFLCNEVISTLCAYSLIRRDPTDKTLSVHRLVQAVLQESLSKEEHQIWVQRVVDAIAAAFPWPEHATWTQCERLLVQARGAAALIDAYHLTTGQAAGLLHALAIYVQNRAQYAEAEPLYLRALRIWEASLGPHHPDLASPLNNLATLYQALGKHAQAEPLYLRALRIWEASLGPEHPLVADLLNNLAILYRKLGKYTDAEPLYQRALLIKEANLGPHHPQVASPLHGLACLYRELGKYEQAKPLFLRALTIREKSLDPHHPHVADPLDGLASLYTDQGKYTDAEPLYQRSLRIKEANLGPHHPQVASPLNNLASLYTDQGKYTDAKPLFLRALCITETSLGPHHPDVAYPLYGLACLYSELGKYEQAEPLFLRALTIWESSLGPHHPDLASSLFGLACLYSELGKYEQAKPLFLRALTIQESSLGKDHPLTRLVREHYDTFQRATHPKRTRSTLGALFRKRL